MPEGNGFEAWITVNDAKLSEYSVEVGQNGKLVTCWIPSEAGQHFSVQWRSILGKVDTAGNVRVDGLRVGGKIIMRNRPIITKKSGIITSPTTSRPFMFSSLETTDDDRYLCESSPQHLGEILLKIDRVVILNAEPYKGKQAPEHEKIHERANKTTAHRVGFGAEIMTQRKHKLTKTANLETLVTFVFRYRPMDILEASGIAPSSTPDPELQCEFQPEADVEAEDEPQDEPPMKPIGRKRKAVEANQKPQNDDEDDEKEEEEEEAMNEEDASDDYDEVSKEVRALQARLDALIKATSKRNKPPTKKVKFELPPPSLSQEVIDLTFL
ncbi:hypothetical protein BDQ12DRAFT_237472 [Crucibulum laeve]|uniref:DUF7918 domain-containing protein n=1 Tax=Crucibulum laeve TaxID=68775 RepID=A0A5C3M6E6_9AGAR|nr:hypothetical protein BDQ12DRAFT_237472 [Crucibulum laeve]